MPVYRIAPAATEPASVPHTAERMRAPKVGMLPAIDSTAGVRMKAWQRHILRQRRSSHQYRVASCSP
eukprot:2650400-Rhodomonas_salina.2